MVISHPTFLCLKIHYVHWKQQISVLPEIAGWVAFQEPSPGTGNLRMDSVHFHSRELGQKCYFLIVSWHLHSKAYINTQHLHTAMQEEWSTDRFSADIRNTGCSQWYPSAEWWQYSICLFRLRGKNCRLNLAWGTSYRPDLFKKTTGSRNGIKNDWAAVRNWPMRFCLLWSFSYLPNFRYIMLSDVTPKEKCLCTSIASVEMR